ncbi:MAG: hypothetical protein K940chlam3_01535 [Chlamydiae bacterium]|nr:hypothetical protein [Chlamydiota bacterium]
MILRLLITLLICCTTTTSLQAGIWDRIKSVFVANEEHEPATIKVLVLHDVPYVDLEVKGTYNLYDPYKNQRVATRFVSKGARIQALSQGLKWGEEFPGVYQLVVVPDHRDVLVSINGRDYRGKFYIYDIGGTLSIVNEIEIEDYLASTMPTKFNRPLNAEALAAAAITERTHSYHVSQYSENHYWDINANDVGYYGHCTENTDPLVVEALGSTRYMVMSKTGIYEGRVTPFPVHLVSGGNEGMYHGMQKVSIDDIEVMARQGDNAAQILSKSFPGSSIELTMNPKHNEEIAEVQITEYHHRSR